MIAPTIIRGDARHVPLADDSVDLIVTSPPYYGLRSYQDGGEHYDGQIGSEATPGEYIAALVDCTREWMRILKPTGSLWVNLGDRYSDRQGPQGTTGNRADRAQAATYERRPAITGFRSKSLLGLPWRYAIRCVDDLGLILRGEAIWSKPNGLPESVTDRVRRSHETWFHLTLRPRYFAAMDEIRQAHMGNAHASGNGASRRWIPSNDGRRHRALDTDPSEYNPLGKLPGSVWEIATQPLTVPADLGVDHFAAFPMEWPRRLIKGWCPPDGVVLDPFGGTGTTATPVRYEPDDYTWQEFQKAFEIACTDAFEAYWEHPDPALSPDPTITLPHSVFPLIAAMVNPLTGKDIPITRISPFDWGKP